MEIFSASLRPNKAGAILVYEGETNPHETIEGPKSKEKVIAWVGLSYECGVIGPFFFEDTEGKSDTVKTANYLEMIKKR